MQWKGTPPQNERADSPHYEAQSHSAATTEPSYSPRDAMTAGLALAHGSREGAPSTAKWTLLRDALMVSASEGDRFCEKYGDIVANQGACERFLHGAKGNLERAIKEMKAHLKWREEYRVDSIIDEDFSDLKLRSEVYWAGVDKNGVPTLTWILRKHDHRNQRPEKFVRFFVHQIESGMRASPKYPNTTFNIMVDLSDVGLQNNDTEMIAQLQPLLVHNYPKVRKALYVFPINWLASLLWDTLLKPILMSLQPDIEDKILPLRGDFRAELQTKFAKEEVETTFGGTLDMSTHPPPRPLPYKSVVCSLIHADHKRGSPHPASSLPAPRPPPPPLSGAHLAHLPLHLPLLLLLLPADGRPRCPAHEPSHGSPHTAHRWRGACLAPRPPLIRRTSPSRPRPRRLAPPPGACPRPRWGGAVGRG